jgi:hypothetical protein
LNEILVDTDVVSYLLNRHSLAEEYEKLLFGSVPMVSFITVAEMYRGAYKRNLGAAPDHGAFRPSASVRGRAVQLAGMSLVRAYLECRRVPWAADRYCRRVHRRVRPIVKHPSRHE